MCDNPGMKTIAALTLAIACSASLGACAQEPSARVTTATATASAKTMRSETGTEATSLWRSAFSASSAMSRWPRTSYSVPCMRYLPSLLT